MAPRRASGCDHSRLAPWIGACRVGGGHPRLETESVGTVWDIRSVVVCLLKYFPSGSVEEQKPRCSVDHNADGQRVSESSVHNEIPIEASSQVSKRFLRPAAYLPMVPNTMPLLHLYSELCGLSMSSAHCRLTWTSVSHPLYCNRGRQSNCSLASFPRGLAPGAAEARDPHAPSCLPISARNHTVFACPCEERQQH